MIYMKKNGFRVACSVMLCIPVLLRCCFFLEMIHEKLNSYIKYETYIPPGIFLAALGQPKLYISLWEHFKYTPKKLNF